MMRPDDVDVPLSLLHLNNVATGWARDTFIEGETGLSHFLATALFAPLNELLRRRFDQIPLRWSVTNSAPMVESSVRGQCADAILADAADMHAKDGLGEAFAVAELKTLFAFVEERFVELVTLAQEGIFMKLHGGHVVFQAQNGEAVEDTGPLKLVRVVSVESTPCASCERSRGLPIISVVSFPLSV
jgi:hypothetical protein